MNHSLRAAYTAALVAAAVAAVPALAGTFSFSNFDDLTAFQLNGSTASIANPVNDGSQNVLRLTDNLNQSGSAFIKNPISLTDANGFQASFSTFFKFRISNPIGISDGDGQGADGIAFVVQTVANTSGGFGGGIGYSGIPDSVGIEYDTYNNGSFANDPDGNHLGIDLEGDILSAKVQSIAKRMNDGDVWYSWVDYDGTTDKLEVRLSINPARPALPTLDYVVDLAAVLGVPDAYVGFTSGTGGAGGNHDILGWEFTATYDPIVGPGPVPEATALCPALAALGLAAILQRRRRATRQA